MARFETNGLAEFSLSMAEISDLWNAPVMDEMLLAEAAIIEEGQRQVGATYGVHRTGVTLSSITHGGTKVGRDGKSIHVYPRGLNADGNRNAEVAFLNEFGCIHNKPARPFIRDANEKYAEPAADAAEEKYDAWLSSKGL